MEIIASPFELRVRFLLQFDDHITWDLALYSAENAKTNDTVSTLDSLTRYLRPK